MKLELYRQYFSVALKDFGMWNCLKFLINVWINKK